MGIIIKTYQIYIALLIIGITAFIIMAPDSQDVNYELIQMIIGICVALIAGTWAFFSYLANLKAERYAKVSNQNHVLLENQKKKIEELSVMLINMKAPTETDKEQNEMLAAHEKSILNNSKDIEIIKIEIKSMKMEILEFKSFIDQRFNDLKEFLEKSNRRK